MGGKIPRAAIAFIVAGCACLLCPSSPLGSAGRIDPHSGSVLLPAVQRNGRYS